MVWKITDPQGDEASKVKYLVVPYTRGVGLDLGCGPRKAFPHFIGVDSCKDTELFGVPIRPDVKVATCERLDEFEPASCDFVFSSHLLEHIEDYRAALAEWWQVIKVGGHLVLYLPHRDLYPNVGTYGANPDHKHDFEPVDICSAMGDVSAAAGTGWDLLVNEVRGAGREYSFLQVYRKAEAHPGVDRFRHLWMKPKPEKTACVCRFGGFGDMIMASNVLPALKREGFHVTLMTTPKGQDILQHDPHVDAWFIQDDNQVPNHELAMFWQAQATRFDRFINLSESVEGTLLPIPGRANFFWPDHIRRRELNKNYLEWTSDLAGVPYASESKFYPSPAEETRARNRLVPGAFNVVFALAGSSIHKFWPHMDSLIARCMLELPDVHFHLVGDHACKILEAGWELEPRVHCLSGELSIRDTLTLAKFADCVLGPETGVLNAVAFEALPKIILLSHSSIENLTKHWINTATLTPTFADDVKCWPCHRLHYSSEHCLQNPETGAALCQQAIGPERAFEPLRRA
ncbi:methyltransferase domain-containing protein [Aromatoleum anaerobium]|uniref:Methyltransferase domain-containing protein n=1 Tax=Aromatoleum anaerobium TaxID=182180 RepID=A0ABX1PSG2_9RHOO|nr:methyltransferase domain-containing protein [Aromatoleum anaerobium]MCK0507907.1 methyltransferase domain-containing protein [Aromatoleum anaerobium]